MRPGDRTAARADPPSTSQLATLRREFRFHHAWRSPSAWAGMERERGARPLEDVGAGETAASGTSDGVGTDACGDEEIAAAGPRRPGGGRAPVAVAPPDFGPLRRPARVPGESTTTGRTSFQSPKKGKEGADDATPTTGVFAQTWAAMAAAVQSLTQSPDQRHASAPSTLTAPPPRGKAALDSLLLASSEEDPLFDDDASYVKIPSRGPRLGDGRGGGEDAKVFFHSDGALLAWVWAAAPGDRGASSAHGRAEVELRRVLVGGRALHAASPRLAAVSGAAPRGPDAADRERAADNLDRLHRTSDGKEGAPAVYRARHPCLAPLLSVTRSDAGLVAVFDVAPARRGSLHERLRAGDNNFLVAPLFPGAPGHDAADFRGPGERGGDDGGRCACPTAHIPPRERGCWSRDRHYAESAAFLREQRAGDARYSPRRRFAAKIAYRAKVADLRSKSKHDILSSDGVRQRERQSQCSIVITGVELSRATAPECPGSCAEICLGIVPWSVLGRGSFLIPNPLGPTWGPRAPFGASGACFGAWNCCQWSLDVANCV